MRIWRQVTLPGLQQMPVVCAALSFPSKAAFIESSSSSSVATAWIRRWSCRRRGGRRLWWRFALRFQKGIIAGSLVATFLEFGSVMGHPPPACHPQPGCTESTGTWQRYSRRANLSEHQEHEYHCHQHLGPLGFSLSHEQMDLRTSCCRRVRT